MHDTTPRLLQLAALGMEKRDRNVLKLFLEKLPQIQCKLVEEAVADASIVDLDAFGSRELLARHRERYPDRPVIVLSVAQQECDGGLFVSKPVRPKQLTLALNDIREWVFRQPPAVVPHAAHEPARTAADAPAAIPVPGYSTRFHSGATTTDPDNLFAGAVKLHESFNFIWNMGPDLDKEIYYRPEWYLQGHVQGAVKLALTKNVVVRLTGASWRPITIFPHSGLISVQEHDGHLRSASLLPQRRQSQRRRKDVVVTFLNKPYSAADDDGHLHQPIEGFLWKLALWTSRGRVPAGTDLDQSVCLRRWPNHTRLLLAPHVLRISALFTQQSCSLLQAAKTLGIELGYVFAYYSAAHAVGLVTRPSAGRRRRAAAPGQPTVPTPGGKPNLLPSILRRLNRFLEDEPL